MLKHRIQLLHRERNDATRVNRPLVFTPIKRTAHPGHRLVTINGKTSEVPIAVVLEDKSPTNTIYKKVIRPINNYVRQLKYLPVSESVTLGKYTMPGIGLAALGAGTVSWIRALPLLRVPQFIGGYIGGSLGGKAVDKVSEITTGKDFALNVLDLTGLDLAVGSFFNPGYIIGGYKGFNWGTNTVRRGAEVAMRTTLEPNPLASIKLAIPSIYNNNYNQTGGPKRLFDIGKYILTGHLAGPAGWSNSFSAVPNAYYRGIFTKRNVRANLLDKADMIDAYLYGKDIDPAYGVRKVAVGEDFGPHESYIAREYSDRASKIPVYEVENDWVTVPEEIPIKANKWDSWYSHSVQNPQFNTTKGTGINVGGHLTQEGNAGIPVQRAQDIWKFKAPEYQTGWGVRGWLAKEGLKTVDYLGTPVVTRTPWQLSPDVFDDGVINAPKWAFESSPSFDGSLVRVEDIITKKDGGLIHINPKNKGKFTASAKKAGLSVQLYANTVLSDPNATPLLKKRANFAKNAKKWKH